MFLVREFQERFRERSMENLDEMVPTVVHSYHVHNKKVSPNPQTRFWNSVSNHSEYTAHDQPPSKMPCLIKNTNQASVPPLEFLNSRFS